MHAFDRLAQAAAEADGEDEVALVDGADQVGDAAGGCGCEDGQAKQCNLIFQIIRKSSGKISGEDDDAASVVESFGEGDKALRVETVLKAVQILEVLLERITNV